MLDFKVETSGGKCIFSIIGRVDAASAPALDSKSQEVFSANSDVVVDCSELEYLSSAGIRVIMRWIKAKYKFVLYKVDNEVKNVLEMTGIDEFLTFVNEI